MNLVYDRMPILIMCVSESPHFQEVTPNDILLTYAVISYLRSLARYGARAYLSLCFEHPASTLPTRFPAALGIGHGSACGLANACALVYVAA